MGCDSSEVPPVQIISHIQNHDQIGNRPNGDRMSTTYGIDKALLACTINFASPYTPMIFMGEEYAEMNPFFFFESFNDQWLIDAVREGRKREFSFIANHNIREPHDVRTFIDSKLDRDSITDTPHNDVLNFYQSIIALKKQKIIGSHIRSEVTVDMDRDNEIIIIKSPKSITLCNLGKNPQPVAKYNLTGLKMLLSSKLNCELSTDSIEGFSARIYSA